MTIKVYVFKRKGRKNFEAEFKNPRTDRKMTRSLGTPIRREAERKAGEIEKELKEGQWKATRKTKWSEFRERYEREHGSTLAPSSLNQIRTVFNGVQTIVNPKTLQVLDASAITKYKSTLLDDGKSVHSVNSYLTTLKAALNWAKDHELLLEVPKIRKSGKGNTSVMKGRPITVEEFERMLAKVGDVVGEDQEKSWKFLLNGVWWSGLRLGEALKLSWTDDREIKVDFNNRRPMFRIKAASEKGKKDRILPMAPEFAMLLREVPENERYGPVFQVQWQRNHNKPDRTDTISKRISEMGEKANVKVSEKKTASAHDLRRSFGLRWAHRVMPAVLKQMMRHSSIETTMKYYVGVEADATAETIWEAFSDNPSDTPVVDESKSQKETPQTT